MVMVELFFPIRASSRSSLICSPARFSLCMVARLIGCFVEFHFGKLPAMVLYASLEVPLGTFSQGTAKAKAAFG